MATIDPNDTHDIQVYGILKRIQYDLKMNEGNKVTYIIQCKPHNDNFYTDQFILDKLAKKGILKVLDTVQTVDDKPNGFESVNFYLKIEINKFEKLFYRYVDIFEKIKKTKFIKTNKVRLVINEKRGLVRLCTSGRIQPASFQKSAINFSILLALAKNKDKRMSFDELGKECRARNGSQTDERQIRDGVSSIRNKLNNHSDEFIKTNTGYTLVCDVEFD